MRNRLRYKQLVLIVAISNLRTLRKVAEYMHMSQPAATKMLQEVEETLGVTLFDRQPKGLVPTAFGDSLVNYAQLMMSDLDNLREKLVALKHGAVGEIAVGTTRAPTPALITQAIVELKRRFPLLTISIHVDTSDELLQMLEQGKLDIVLGRIADHSEHAGVNFEELDRETLSVVVGSHHPLARAERLTLADLADSPWILQPVRSSMRNLMELMFRQYGIPIPRNLVETASVLTTTTLLRSTDMVAVLSDSIARDYAEIGWLRILPVDIELRLEPYGIITRKERFPAPAVATFQECLRSLAIAGRTAGNEKRHTEEARRAD